MPALTSDPVNGSGRRDQSTWALVASNLFTLVIAVIGQWRLADLMWVYWGQSVVIGFWR